MKIYRVKEDWYSSLKREGTKRPLWTPSKDQFRTQDVLRSIAGREFPAFESIQGGIEGAIYIHIGKNPLCQSEVFAVDPELLEDTGKTVQDYAPPIEETSGGWWKKEKLEVVRLLVQDFTDGFMAFTKGV